MDKHVAQKKWPKILLLIVTILLLGAAGWYGWQWYQSRQESQQDERQSQNTQQDTSQPRTPIAERFVERYYEVDLPGVDRISEPPEVVSNGAADRHIRSIAEERGYRLQYTPNRPLEDINGEQLQPEAIEAWQRLKQAASEDNVSLRLVSGYRSVETQQIIFDSQLAQRAKEEQDSRYTARQITNGEADEDINAVLQEYSIPGYSKHHSGYTIDVNDAVANQSLDQFGQTEAYEWLSDNEYANAREYGFLPSYPEGVNKLGPEAELWEYVWVGAEHTDFEQN